MEPFSLRHLKSLQTQVFKVSMRDPLRSRLWQTIEKYNRWYSCHKDPSDNWETNTSHIAETEQRLARLLGMPELTSRASAKAVGIKGYFLHGYPSCALDVIEQFVQELTLDEALAFHIEVNDATVAFDCPWWLSNGRFFKIDDAFFQVEIVQKAEDFLCERGFEGAHNEFREAREDLTDGKTKDVIVKAFKSFESALKTVGNTKTGNVSDLLTLFREAGFLDDIPVDKQQVVTTVLRSIALLRNELGGHGQGNSVVDVPRPYAVLAIHLAGSFNQFVLSQHLRKSNQATSQ
ncbi:DUF7014 domain-containing protein [Candidatus Nitrospira nitrificans]|uniref:DUF7014 domain-containing protein n=1 Tax=Candidatus Nitrospira nitrificans TaxID=1742973 RepID=A0A0S4LIY7_9BACT|nr:hypothetical protein [Candidatus Nitrospira nitrificans]CUS37553.1 hypothetical protein COMA2_30331 [Candidatus Nitrospira nitrificans]